MSTTNNFETVIKNKEIPVNTELDINMTNAYLESQTTEEHVENVMHELDSMAADFVLKSPEELKIKEKNMYTKLTLDESIEDFNVSIKSLNKDFDDDEYLDYDMFDFVYGLVTDDWPKPKNPLNRRMRKFQHTESDDYIKTNEPTGMSQVATDSRGNVVVYANTVDAFNDIREACDYYHLEYSDVLPRKNKDSHWAFNMTIYVPATADGYPVMVEDFFADYGWSLTDVIEDQKVGGGKSTNWGVTYNKRVDKDRAEAPKYINDKAVKNIFDKFIIKAANSNEPLEIFIKEMFSELNAKKLSYSKSALKKQFMAEFQDDFEDDDITED